MGEPAGSLIDKLRDLQPELVREVEAFVDRLRGCEERRKALPDVAALSQKTFAETWDNDEDSVYDAL